ncbi:MAG: hypothetical protein ACI9UK_001100 [Candidatus Krumholzibacteriia bacterium]|jgi:hypothetical protein
MRLLPVYALLIACALIGCGSDDGTNISAPNDNLAPGTISNLGVSWANESSVNLSWTATGDDAQDGTAKSYELRMAAYPTDPFGWDNWDIITLTGKPLAAGQTQSHTVSGLAEGSVHVYRMVVRDEAGNASDYSNPVIATTAPQYDSTPPSAVTDLATWSSDGSHIEVAWTASGDDGLLGQATEFEVRSHTEPINLTNWASASAVATGTPGLAGDRINSDITGLTPDTIYHFAVRMRDDEGQWSQVSNSLAAETIVKNTWYVKPDGTGDVATVQAAINSAKDGDTILVAAGTYSWTSQGTDNLGVREWGMMLFNREVQNIHLRSESGPASTIIDMEGKGRAMYLVGYNDGVVIEGFTFTNGNAILSTYGYGAGGAILMHLSSPTLRNCVFSNSRGTQGGGVANVGQNEAVIEDCQFVNNSSQWGGGYYGVNSIPRSLIKDCEFLNNRASATGAGAVIDSQAVDIINCLFVGNISENKAGAVAFYRNHETTMSGCTIVNNHAPTTSAVRVLNIANVSISNCIVAGNTGGAPFFRGEESDFIVSCTNVYDNGLNNAFPDGYIDEGNNTLLDPLFIGGEGPDAFDLQGASPCRAQNHPSGSCGDLGYSR